MSMRPIASIKNIASIADFYTREEQRVGSSQKFVEQLGTWMGRPLHVGVLLAIIIAWIAFNTWGQRIGFHPIDPPPHSWLSLALTAYALLMTLVVLVKQNRFGKLEEHRAHLDLQVNLLTEQKVSKLIRLIEELRRDLPSVQKRTDPELTELEKEADPQAVLSSIEQQLQVDEKYGTRNH